MLVDDGSEKYLFIDEVQNVKGFEEVVNTYRNDGDFFDLPHGVELIPFVRWAGDEVHGALCRD